jgi:four helix bundle protein
VSKIALKELNETKVWLQIIARSQMILKDEFFGLQKECDELCRIISASVKTAIKRRNNN